MSNPTKYCLPGIALLLILFSACKKATIEPKTESEFLSPPPPLCQTGACNITNGKDFFYWFASPLPDYEGELHYELSVQPAPYAFTFDQNGNPLTCQGYGVDACLYTYFNSTFAYTNGKLSSITIDRTFGPSCPNNMYLQNVHTVTRVDFSYGYRMEQVSGFPVLFPVTNATVYKSDTVLLGQNVNSFTPTGRTYYYEYGMSGDKLRIKRYKRNASAATKEFAYTYDTDGHLTKMIFSDNGIEQYRFVYYSWDTRKNFASGNAITQLLTSSYGKNNPRQWYIKDGIQYDYFNADYLYNFYCYPVTVDITRNNFTYNGIQISYSCQ